jgi:hypothetical protein
MQKEIKKDKGSFVIGYWQTSDDIDLYIGNNHSDPIKVFFYPNIKMTEQECKNYTKDFIPKLENEMVFIINQNQQFYQNFDITFCGEFTGFSFGRDETNRDKLIVSNATMYAYCKLKEK